MTALVPLAFALTAAVLMTLLLRRGRPRDATAWLALTLSALVIVASAALAVVLRGAQAPQVYDLSELTAAPPPAPPLAAELVGAFAPEASFANLSTGGRMSLSDLRGRVVVLNLWATWCPPCLRELPDLSRLSADYGPLGLTVVTLSDEPVETIQAFARARELQTLVAQAGPGTLAPPYEAARRTLPTTFVIDREGVVRHVKSGARTYQELAELVQPLLQPGLAAR
jgi:peroxiredoxin